MIANLSLTGLVREIRPEDFQAAQNLIETVKNIMDPPGFSWTAQSLLSELHQASAEGLWVDHELVAVLVFRKLTAAFEITCLGVHPAHARRGFMKRLLGAVINAYGQQWWLEVHEANRGAIELYLQLGFVVTGHRRHYYPDGGDALLMSFHSST